MTSHDHIEADDRHPDGWPGVLVTIEEAPDDIRCTVESIGWEVAVEVGVEVGETDG